MLRLIFPTATSLSVGLLLILQSGAPASGIAPGYGLPTLAPLPSESVAMRTIEAKSDAATTSAADPNTAAASGAAVSATQSGVQYRRPRRSVSRTSGNQPSSLFGDIGALNKRRIKVGGWLQQGITFNGSNPADRFNGPVATNDLDGEYQMNQFWLYAVRPIDTSGGGWDIGGRIDMLYGSDFRFGINHGLEDRINNVANPYGMVIPQAYIEVGVNKLSVKLGHFAGILDYEAVPAVANPFYSHSYSYGYTVPQLVTGALADYKITDRVSVQGGFHRGWMMFEDLNSDLDFMGGVKWASRDKRTDIAFGVSHGAQDLAGDQERFVYSLVVKRQVTKKFQYVLVHNYGCENDAVLTPQQTRADGQWYGINQYFLYQINPRWSAGLRFEWLRDDDGARIAGVPTAIPPVKTWPGGPGFAGDFFELTAGVSWRPHPNIVLRPEARWDWYDGSVDLDGDLPFNAGTSGGQFTFGTDLIVTY